MAIVAERTQDIIFKGIIIKIKESDKVLVRLFIEECGRKNKVGDVILSGLDGLGDNAIIFDRAFQRWVVNGFYYNAKRIFKNPVLLAIMETAQNER